jgi:hypothetical protein
MKSGVTKVAAHSLDIVFFFWKKMNRKTQVFYSPNQAAINKSSD